MRPAIDWYKAEGITALIKEDYLCGGLKNLVGRTNAWNTGRHTTESRVLDIAVFIQMLDLVPKFRFVDRSIRIRSLPQTAISLEIYRARIPGSQRYGHVTTRINLRG